MVRFMHKENNSRSRMSCLGKEVAEQKRKQTVRKIQLMWFK